MQKTMCEGSIKKAEEQRQLAERKEASWWKKVTEVCKTAAFVAQESQEASKLPDIALSCIGRHNHWDPRECAVQNFKEWQIATERYCACYGKSGLVIPKHIHQIWVGPKEPPCVWLDTWRVSFLSSHPGWEYTLWTDVQADSLQMENQDLYDSEQMWQCKADILRLEVLWRHGGIYIDADMVSVKSRAIEELIERSRETGWSIAYEPDTKDKPISVLGNSVICCTPYHPLTMMLIKYLKATFGPMRHQLQVFQLTGPVMYTKCLTHMSYTVLPQELIYPAFHYVPNPSSIDFDRFPKALMFQFGYTCSGLEDWVKRNNCCQYCECPYHFPMRWEEGPNRVLKLPRQGVFDRYRASGGGPDVKVEVDGYVTQDRNASVRFHVECNWTRPEERVFVVGSLPELGAWDPASAIKCYTTAETFPVWSSEQQMLSLRGHAGSTIDFKVLVQVEKSATASWRHKSEELCIAQLWSAVKKQWTEHLASIS